MADMQRPSAVRQVYRSLREEREERNFFKALKPLDRSPPVVV